MLSLGIPEKSLSPFCSLHPLHTHTSHERHIHTDKSLPSSSLWDCMAAGHQIRAVTSTGSVSTGLCWSMSVSTQGRRGEGSPGATQPCATASTMGVRPCLSFPSCLIRPGGVATSGFPGLTTPLLYNSYVFFPGLYKKYICLSPYLLKSQSSPSSPYFLFCNYKHY